MLGVSILKDRWEVSLYADVYQAYAQFNSMNCWQFSCCDKREKTLISSQLSVRDFILKTKYIFAVVCIYACSVAYSV